MSPVRIVGGIAVSNWDLQALAHGRRDGWRSSSYFLRSTKEGQFLVAVSDNAKLAELYGISAKRAYRITAVIAGLFICAAMYLTGTRGGVTPNSPFELVLAATIATLLGGMGRVFMGALAAVILALIQSFSVLVISSRWQNLLLYGFLFVTITLFPRGINIPRLRPKVASPAPGTGAQPANVIQGAE